MSIEDITEKIKRWGSGLSFSLPVVRTLPDGGHPVYVVDLKSGAAKQIAADAESAAGSPDGRRVALASARGLWLVDADGREVATVLPPRAKRRKSLAGNRRCVSKN